MPISIGDKTFEKFDDAVKFMMESRGFSEKTAKAIVAKIEQNQRASTAYGNVPELFENEKGKFAKFFLINPDWNMQDWRVTNASIPLYLDTFKDMPYISEPALEHVVNLATLHTVRDLL